MQVHLHLAAMAADSPPSPVHTAPPKWPNNRSDYEILEVVGEFRWVKYLVNTYPISLFWSSVTVLILEAIGYCRMKWVWLARLHCEAPSIYVHSVLGNRYD